MQFRNVCEKFFVLSFVVLLAHSCLSIGRCIFSCTTDQLSVSALSTLRHGICHDGEIRDTEVSFLHRSLLSMCFPYLQVDVDLKM
ncbi:hypothetical protein BVRB_1g022510 [Beta vulgaris subsp. vulgaris]|nr:hypothetical protein BVRB_1g022510 [Beta vulgaris subsp. vulgaris]